MTERANKTKTRSPSLASLGFASSSSLRTKLKRLSPPPVTFVVDDDVVVVAAVTFVEKSRLGNCRRNNRGSICFFFFFVRVSSARGRFFSLDKNCLFFELHTFRKDVVVCRISSFLLKRSLCNTPTLFCASVRYNNKNLRTQLFLFVNVALFLFVCVKKNRTFK